MEDDIFCPYCNGQGYTETATNEEPCYKCEGGYVTELKGEENVVENNTRS